MSRRFVSIWFPHLSTDWKIRRQPKLEGIPFIFAAPEQGRMIIKAASRTAQDRGVHVGMVVADCRAILPTLEVFDNIPGLEQKLLTALGEWCIRYTPIVATDGLDGLILDVSGCTHLWGGELPYLKDILSKLIGFGYDARGAMADTIGAAWAISRFGKVMPIIKPGGQLDALLPLPPAALRLDQPIIERLEKLGLYQIRNFISMPPSSLRRRFGQQLLTRISQALGSEAEPITCIAPVQPYQERLPCLEPIRTAIGIEIALKKLLEALCKRLRDEGKGLRRCMFKGYRIDGNIQQIDIGTNRPSRSTEHLFKLFEIKISTLEPDLGFELFLMEAPVVEYMTIEQEKLWDTGNEESNKEIAELLDRMAGKLGGNTIHRYLPTEHYWPERSAKPALTITEQTETPWRTDMPRPVHILPQPELIDVTVPMPDYPPMQFHYKGKLHRVSKADGPERIEQEWWLQNGQYRDYYCVEDEEGGRYWLFRSGHYKGRTPEWYIHGFFA